MVTPVLTLKVDIGSVIFGGDTYLLLFFGVVLAVVIGLSSPMIEIKSLVNGLCGCFAWSSNEKEVRTTGGCIFETDSDCGDCGDCGNDSGNDSGD